MIAAINYNVCLSRNGYADRLGRRQVVVELYQQGRRRVINTHVHVPAADFAHGRIQPSHPDHDLLNRRIRRIVRQLMELEDEMLDRDVAPTPQRLAEAYLHHQTQTATVRQWVESIVLPSQRRPTTKGVYRTLCQSLDDFQPDLRLGDLSHDVIERWQNWMRNERHLCPNTITCRLKALRCLVSEAVKRDVIRADHDPFRHIRIPEITPRCEHLSEQELALLEQAPLTSDRLRRVRDAFLFCCLTGLRWSDFRALTSANLVTQAPPDGTVPTVALQLRQHKTGRPLQLPLTSLFGGRPLQLIARNHTLERLTDIGDNQYANRLLRQVAAEARLPRHLHWHLARHTCATLLNQHGLRMQEIQYILGHRKQLTTERHYAATLYEQVHRSLAAAFG